MFDYSAYYLFIFIFLVFAAAYLGHVSLLKSMFLISMVFTWLNEGFKKIAAIITLLLRISTVHLGRCAVTVGKAAVRRSE